MSNRLREILTVYIKALLGPNIKAEFKQMYCHYCQPHQKFNQ